MSISFLRLCQLVGKSPHLRGQRLVGSGLRPCQFGSDRAPLSSNRARRRSIFARVKFLSGLFAVLNLLPSMATAGRRQKTRFLAEFDEARNRLAQRQAVVLAEVRNRL
ncbi:hypothetical protein [Bradyrhizobium tropiciagri]|uniref:hypothetical protein n=1 Tax=Bradyrhizobium tropiciagri TaxID=312253 RepID=UPI001009AE20|nr:hypothetical protein [Bradyrhizobium tropiciagri]